MEQQAVKIQVFGYVQGVGYRQFVKQRAVKLKLTGRICNLKNGTVEVVVQGSAASIKTLLEQCKNGPLGATVHRLTTEKMALEKKRIQFVITH